MKISIVIPVYNEEKYIVKTIEKVISSNCLGYKKEIIIVDDASTDNSSKVIKKFLTNFTDKKNTIIFIQKKINEGKSSVLKLGILKSKGDIVLIQDADLEYNPEDYPLLLEPLVKNEADVVYGSRFISDKPHRVLYFWHYLGNLFLTIFSNMFTNLNLTDIETGYKVFKGDIVRKIAYKLQSKRFGFEPEITAKIAKIKGIRIFEVGISYRGRTYDEGKKIGWKDGIRAIWEIIRFNLFS